MPPCTGVGLKFNTIASSGVNPIKVRLLRFRAKTVPQIKEKPQDTLSTGIGLRALKMDVNISDGEKLFKGALIFRVA